MGRVLLIEPDAVLRGIYETILAAHGHTVVCCRSAQEGISCADEQCPDIILLELQLVGHSGIEFLYELRSYNEWQAIPVVVHSHVPPQEFANSLELMREKLGVSEYHYKPHTSLNRLLSVVNQLLAPAVA